MNVLIKYSLHVTMQMDGSIVSGIQLKVTLARRQPVINPINDATSSAVWTTLGMLNKK